MSDRDSNDFLWFVAGLGLGALIGVLYAPQPGRETRRKLREVAEDSRDYVLSSARKAREGADEWVARGREVISSQKEKLGSAVEAGRQAYREAAETGGKAKNL